MVLEFNVLAAIADFDTGQIVMGQSICDGSLSTYQKLTVLQYNLTALWTPKVSWCLCGMKVRISGPIPKRAALWPIAEKIAGYKRNVSESTQCIEVQCIFHCWKCLLWTHEHQNWTMDQWKKMAWSYESQFLWDTVWEARCLCITCLGMRWHWTGLGSMTVQEC